MNLPLLRTPARAWGALLALPVAWAALAPGALQAAETHRLPSLPQPVETEARVIVKFRSDAAALRSQAQVDAALGQRSASAATVARGPRLASTLGTRLGLSLQDGRTLDARTQVMRGSRLAVNLSSAELAQRLADEPDVEWAVPDHRRYARGSTVQPGDPYYADGQTAISPAVGQWYLRAPTATLRASINMPPAWAITEGQVVVAVLDTGVRFKHPDLAGRLLSGYDFVSDSLVANDANARDSDASDPGDWISTSMNSSGVFMGCGVSDSSWHGTQTAGLVAAATHNGIGIAGIGPGLSVLPLRVLGRCGGYDSDIIAAMRWAGGLGVSGVPTNTHPARVINLSLGGSEACTSAYTSALAELKTAGVLVVAAAGNQGLAVETPANCSGVLAVAGLRHAGSKVGYSNLGPEVGVAAPAGNCGASDLGDGSCLYPILTTSNAGTTTPTTSSYAASLGTSFAAPMVAGVAGLMFSANPALTPDRVTALLKSSATAFPTSGGDAGTPVCAAPTGQLQDSECYCTTSTCGAGMLNAGEAVRAAAASVNGVVAGFSASEDRPAVGDTLTLDAASYSQGKDGAALTTYQWTIGTGASLARFVGATDGASVQLQITASGDVAVTLTVTDANGLQNSSTHLITHAQGSSDTSDGTSALKSGGGGAWGPLWGGLLWLAALAWPVRRRRPGR